MKEDKVKSLDKPALIKANSSEMEDHIAPELLLTVITKDAGTIKKQDKHLHKTMMEDHIVLEQLLTATIKDAGTIKSKVKLLLRMISLTAMVLPLVQTIKDANGQKKQPLSNYQHVKVKLVNFLEKIALLSPILASTEKTRKPKSNKSSLKEIWNELQVDVTEMIYEQNRESI